METGAFGASREAEADRCIAQTEEVVAPDRVTFMLRPDRRSPDGRPYNPYRVEAVFVGCAIVQLTVVELISWE